MKIISDSVLLVERFIKAEQR